MAEVNTNLGNENSIQSDIEKETKTICPYCGVGCSLILKVKSNKILSSKGNPESPVNKGNLCIKGSLGYEFVNHPDRLTKPLIKKEGKFVETSWEEALNYIARKFDSYKGNLGKNKAGTK